MSSPRKENRSPRERPLIAFFDYPDVFEDFYPHYGVDQQEFATRWAETGNHAFASLLQRDIGDVIWYAFSLSPKVTEAVHEVVGCRVRILSSSWLHRSLWKLFYTPRVAWRWRGAYPVYATVASYVSLLSSPFIRMLWRDRPDFFFVQDYATGRFDVLLLLSRLMGVPLIAYHSGSQPEKYVGRVVKRWTIPRADWLIPSSRDERQMLATRYRALPERLTVILTPIDTNLFRPVHRTPACHAVGLDPRRRYLLFVGRLDDQVKRVGALVRVFAAMAHEHAEASLLVAGEGPDGEMLRRLAAEQAPSQIHFIGWVKEKGTLVQFYNAAECLILPSRSEGFPTVIGEAMACGLPVLASDVGGVGEMVVHGKTGWLIPPCDDEALAATISFVLTNPEAAESMRAGARAMAEEQLSPGAVTVKLRKCFSTKRWPND